MASTPPSLVFGAFTVQPHPETGAIDAGLKTLDVMWETGLKHIDTAQIYGQNELGISKANADRKYPFTIDTKVAGGFRAGSATFENIVAHGTEARKLLGPINVYYIHAPDNSLPLEPQLEAIQELYKAGVFKKFGLSNFKPEDVQRVYDYQKSKGYVLPTVFQGNYNAFARGIEKSTFPKLRELGISFYAYSPLAGGLLAKTRQQLETAEGRWEKGSMLGNLYRELYDKDVMLEALDDWAAIAKSEGISLAELGYRWIRYHAGLKGELGDAVLFGATTDPRIVETAGWLEKGPISEEAAKKIDEIWPKIEHVAPHDNYHK